MTLLQDSSLQVERRPWRNQLLPSMRNNELLLGLLLCCLRTLYTNLGTWDAPAIATLSPDDGHPPLAHQPASFGGAGRMSLRHSTVTPRVIGEGRPLRSLRSVSQYQSRLPKLHLLRSQTLSFHRGMLVST